MTQVLPFSTLLDLLRLRGLEIGLTEYRDLGLLLSRYDHCNPAELRTAIAALIARDRLEHKLIAECFDDLFAGVQTLPRPPEDSTRVESTGRREAHPRRWISFSPWATAGVAAAVLLLAILIVPIVLAFTTAPALPPLPAPPLLPHSAPLALPSTPTPAMTPPQPDEPRAPLRRRWDTLAAPAGTACVVILALRIGRRTAARRSSWLRSVRHSQLASMGGPRFYRWRVDDRVDAIPRHVVEEVATILGRRHEVARTGNHLDVHMTIRRTLEAGLFPRLVFEPPCRTLPLLVLQDIGADMRPWQPRIDHLLEDLARLGVPIWRYYFDVTANDVWRSRADAGTTLDALARSTDDAALMVISAGAGVRTSLSDRSGRSWVHLLERWPARTWITPLTSRAHWRPELAGVPMAVWPMTSGGLHAAARDLLLDATHRPTAPPDALAGARRVGIDDLERVKRLVALVPPPVPVDLVNALRARFTPDVPADVLLPLLAENESLDSAAVRLPDAEVKRLLASLRRDNPDREAEVRRFLLGLLEASEPPQDSVAYLRWQTDRALHQALLADSAGQEPSDPLAVLESLASGPLRDEVKGRTAQVAASGRIVKPLGRVSNVPASRSTYAASEVAAPLRSALNVSDAVVVVAGAALAVATFVAVSGGIDRRTVDHQRDVWSLEWDPAQQALTASASSRDAPQRNVSLVRDGARLASVSLSNAGSEVVRDRLVDRGETGSWYQLQAPLREGNLALSNLVWVPGPVKPGHVIATFRASDGRPLPEVRFTLTASNGGSIDGLAGRSIEVAPGYWTLGVQMPGYQPLDEPVTVQSNADLRREFTLTTDTSLALSGELRIELRDVYGDPAAPPLDVRLTRGGRPIDAVNNSPRGQPASQSYTIDWAAAGAVQVGVTSPLYQPLSFSAVGKPGAITVSRQLLLMEPKRVRPSFSGDPKEVVAIVGRQGPTWTQNDETHANLLNIFARASTVIVTLERPQGTFSRDLWSLLKTIENVTPGSVQATVSADYLAYLSTWMRLGSRGSGANKPDEAMRQQQQVQQQQQQSPAQPNAPPAASIQRFSVPPQRGDRVILELELQPSRAVLTLSLHAAKSSEAHPYLMHQLLVQDGYKPLYRLRAAAAAATAK